MPRYEFRSVLGSGTSGVVFEAWDSILEAVIAIKVLRRLEAPEQRSEDEDRLARFKREMRLNRRLRHPGIARLYDYGEADGLPFVTMELVRGRDLREIMEAEETVPVDRAVALLHNVAGACAAAHAAGVIHRDIKPENVMVQEGDQTVVLDLGLSYDLRSPSETPIGMVVGTPLYMAPEAFQGFRADARSDVYALGVIGFEMLAGEPPFPVRGSPLEMLFRRLRNPVSPAPLRERGIAESLVEILLRCLERKPEERFESAIQLADALSALRAQDDTHLPVATEVDSPVVLVVDDDAMIRKLLRLVLDPLGCEVVECDSGESALRQLTMRQVDVVLLDIVMPGMDGFDVLQLVRSTPGISRTPVVFVSARADRGRRAFALQQGADAFLEKPVDPAKVLQVVRNWLG